MRDEAHRQPKKLTDNQIRGVNKLLEAGRPLSDKCRFLLFEDKREVELVWNGKMFCDSGA